MPVAGDSTIYIEASIAVIFQGGSKSFVIIIKKQEVLKRRQGGYRHAGVKSKAKG